VMAVAGGKSFLGKARAGVFSDVS